MLEDLLHCGNTKRSSIGCPPFTALCLFFEHDPEVVGARICINPDLGNIHIEQTQHIGRQMDKAIIAISSLGPCPILIVWAKTNMNALFAKFEVFHSHTKYLPDAESSLFEHEAQQTITESGRIIVRVLPHMNALNEGLEILL